MSDTDHNDMPPSVYDDVVERAMALKLPLDAMWELTYRCNLTCCHCYLAPTPTPELDTATCEGILRQMADAGVLWLTFTGGEPLVRDDAFHLMRYARDLKFALTLFTNGTLIGLQEAEKLADLKLHAVEVSIYGSYANLHDSITGMPGSFDLTMRGVELMLQRHVPVTLKSCILNSNVHDADNTSRLAANLGVRFRSTSYLSPRNDGDTAIVEDNRLSKEELKTVFSDGNPGMYPRHETNCFSEDDLKSRTPCSAGQTICGITPDGRLLPCLQFVNGGDSLLDHDFLSLWKDADNFREVRSIRLSDLEPCNRCPGLNVCNRCQGIALIENGDLYGASEEACRNTRIIMELNGVKTRIPPA